MKAPEAPLALIVALLPSALLFGMAYWRFRVAGGFTHFTVGAFSFGAALAALVVAVSTTYVWPSFSAAQASDGLMVAPLLVYGGSFITLGRASKLSAPGLVIGGVVALVPLYFVGLYVWLFTACGFGNCL